jgi:hypothetical protein
VTPRERNVREAQQMDLSDLVVWGIGENDNPYRMEIVRLEIQRRVAAAQIDAAAASKWTARYTLLAIIAALSSALVGWLISMH